MLAILAESALFFRTWKRRATAPTAQTTVRAPLHSSPAVRSGADV